MFILLSVPDLFRVMDSDESGRFRELGSEEDYDGYSSRSRSRSSAGVGLLQGQDLGLAGALG